MLTRVSHQRFWIINLFIILLFPLIIIQLLRLSISEESALIKLAKKQHNLTIEIQPKRGNILDRNGKEFAMNLKVPSIFAVPRLIKDKPETAARIAKILGKSEKYINERLSRDKAFVWLERGATTKEAEAIQALKNPNLGIVYENRRFYPNSEMLANVVGFCNIDSEGIEGIEMIYDKHLKGRSGYRVTKRDAMGREVVAFEEKYVPAIDGADVSLTIDYYIQYLAERSLDEAFRKYKAKGAMAVVMNPNTGEILALANRPTFDPNSVNPGQPEKHRNRAITDIYEPGSIFKMITAAAALAENKVTLTEKFDCEKGEWNFSKRRVIHDVHPKGILTFPEVIQESSNIGTVKIALKLGDELMYRYCRLFGFGQNTGIDLPGEVAGILHPLEKWSKVSIAAVPYGQEVSATALQMVTAISAIANGGKLMKPYVIKEIRDRNNVTILKNEPVIKTQIISSEVSKTMRDILQLVVTNGTGKAAKIDGVRVAGKTGTSQKIENGTYSHSHFISSFIGFAPADNPKLAMIVSVDEPRGAYYGGVVAAPVFKQVIEEALIYMGHVPDRELAVREQAERIVKSAVKTGKKEIVKSGAPGSLPTSTNLSLTKTN